LADGTLLVAFKESLDHHRSDDAALIIARSSDGGATWPWRRPLAAAPGWAYFTNHGLTRLSNGTLLCPVMRHRHVTPTGAHPGITREVYCTFARSLDGGATWLQGGADLLFAPLSARFHASYGRPHELGAGRLMVPVFGIPRGAEADGRRTTGVAFTEDVAATWTHFVPIWEDTQGDFLPSETELLRLADGRYLAMIRASVPRLLYRSYSADDGQTWTPPEPTALPGQSPSLLTLSSGAILCAFRDVTEGRPGMSYAVSSDGGTTWSAPTRLYDAQTRDCGYPSFAQSLDGQLHCAFYTASTPPYAGASEIHVLRCADRSLSR
jgi:hypothetical protein